MSNPNIEEIVSYCKEVIKQFGLSRGELSEFNFLKEVISIQELKQHIRARLLNYCKRCKHPEDSKNYYSMVDYNRVCPNDCYVKLAFEQLFWR